MLSAPQSGVYVIQEPVSSFRSGAEVRGQTILVTAGENDPLPDVEKLAVTLNTRTFRSGIYFDSNLNLGQICHCLCDELFHLRKWT
jgi:hypothetical protein